jgi:rhodanese-related sulfurtransferase
MISILGLLYHSRTKTLAGDLFEAPPSDEGSTMPITSSKQLVAEASGKIEALSPEAAVRLMNSPEVVFVDVRETLERQKTGSLKGAIHAPRGFLEFYADPSSPTHLKDLSSGKKLILYCASGNRSVLAASTLQSMGIHNVAHVAGGLPALRRAGALIEDTA